MRLAVGLSRSVAFDHIARLAAAGLVEQPLAGDGEGAVVVVTRAGVSAAEEHGAVGTVWAGPRAASSARHGRAVSWVAASAQLRGWRWLGPAELRSESGWRVRRPDGISHVPDLGLVVGEKRFAVEVELHRKAPGRLAAILTGYRSLVEGDDLHGVSYIADNDDVVRLVRRQAQAAGLGSALEIGPLETLVEQVRQPRSDARPARRPEEAGT